MPAYDRSLFTPLAPLASVTLRNPATDATLDDVPMLIDSGADVTLVPEEFVLRLGAQVDLDSGYELAGFDGSRSIAWSSHLHLLLLGRTFKGRFLLIRRPWGVIGRNVLNHLSLLLDGPRLTWQESSTVARS